ncbi:DUF2207 domain-containing protein [Candidatus Saccharibacteria bacterium]|nr:DUF2207 domain-containing protein [Candidatus Saccharibacteria bacterium]
MIQKIKLGSFFTILLLVGSLIISGVTGASSVNNFQFSNFSANYYLSKNSEGQSFVRVEEVFTAEFPNYNQNKGMVRAIPEVYQNHSVKFKLISVERNGVAEPIYSQYSENNNRVVETGTEQYLLGTQKFKFVYELTSVTNVINNTQEFYWNIIGNQFSQPFLSADATIHLSSEIKKGFTGEMKCYVGSQSASYNCESSYNNKEATAHFKLTEPLPPQSSFTVAMQFAPETFAIYKDSPWQIFIKNYSLFILGAISILAGVWSLVALRKNQTPKSKSALIAEYLPPKGLSVMEASGLIVPPSPSVLPAEILDLAVRHKVNIIESKEKRGMFGEKNKYTIELINTDGLLPDEANFLQGMLGSLNVGARYTFNDHDYNMGTKLNKIIANSQSEALTEKGFLEKSMGFTKLRMQWGAVILATILSIIIIFFNTTPSPTILSISFAMLSMFASIALILYATGTKIYTKEGRQMQQYLEGLKMYIKLAEVDRLNYLQSPVGAERAPINTSDQEQMIKLYERVLPYAVLFRLEKDWAKVLELKYQESTSTPSWYSGSDISRGIMLGSFISNFNSSTASSFSPPTSSSGSGISGGFAGGGGGGGGGGGR